MALDDGSWHYLFICIFVYFYICVLVYLCICSRLLVALQLSSEHQGGGTGWRILTLSSISPSPSHQCQSLNWKASHCAHCYMILTMHCTNGRVQTTSGRSQAEQCTEFSGIANLHQSNRQCLGPTADPRLPKRQISFWTCNCLCFWDSHRKHSHRYITIVFVMCH